MNGQNMKRYKLVFAIVLCLFCTITACGKKVGNNEKEQQIAEAVMSWQEQYDLGIRLLNEGKYEEAILAFQAAIQIDSKRAEAYVSLADSYVADGQIDKAQEVLEEALEKTDDASLIQEKLNEIQGSKESEAVENQNQARLPVGATEIYWSWYDFTLNFFYNENGQEVKREVYNMSDGSLNCVYEYVYNEDGQMAASTLVSADGLLMEKREYEYTTDGAVAVERYHYYYDGMEDMYRAAVKDQYQLDKYLVDTEGIAEYTYNDKGQLIGLIIKATRFMGDYDYSNTVVQEHTYSYDEYGKLVKEKCYKDDGYNIYQNDTAYWYDEEGQIVLIETYADGSLASFKTYDYDDVGRLVYEEYQVDLWGEGSFEKLGYKRYHYNEASELISVDIGEEWGNDGWVEESVIEYIYE